MKRLLFILIVLLCAVSAHAQATTVSGQIVATNAQSWNNGSYQIQFYPPANNPTGPFVWNGQPFSRTTIFNGSLDGTGSFTQSLPSNTAISPGGSQWQFTVCPNATAPCYSTILTITGATQNVTSNIVPPAIAINMTNPPPAVHTYLNSELISPSVGQSYWNVSSDTALYWDGIMWVPIGGGGSGGCRGSGPFTVPGLIFGSTTTVCSSTAFNYYSTGATGSAGYCNNSSGPAIPAIYNIAGNYDTCFNSQFFSTENLGLNEVSISTPTAFQVGTLSSRSVVCPDATLAPNLLTFCGLYSAVNYTWTESVSAANTFTIAQTGGTGSLQIDNTGHITVSGCTGCGGLSGLTTDGILFAISATQAATINPPATNNGSYNCGYTVTANAAVDPTCYQIGLSSRSVTGSTDTIAYTDNNQTVEYQGSGAVAVTLPTPTTLENPQFFTVLDNLTTGAGTAVTITPTTFTINGNSTLVMSQNQSCRIGIDPNSATNWLAVCNVQNQYRIRICEGGLGDGVNAMAAATYPQFDCVNTSGVTWTIVSISCYVDNGSASSTLAAANNAGTDLLTGPVTCNNTKSGGGAAGTLSGTTTLANNDAINFSFVADGTSKTTTWTVTFRQ